MVKIMTTTDIKYLKGSVEDFRHQKWMSITYVMAMIEAGEVRAMYLECKEARE